MTGDLRANLETAAKLPSELFLFALSALTVCIGSTIAFLVLKESPRFGIDDANITHIYARNLASGFGYVFNPGGERVEGSTSALWTAINAVAFMLPGPKPLMLLTLCTFLTVATVYCSLLLTRSVAREFCVDERWTVLVYAVGLACVPGYFSWNVWSLMDITLWSLECVLLALAAFHLVGAAQSRAIEGAALALLCAAAVATRPEAIAVVIGLLAVTAALRLAGPADQSKGTLYTLGVALAAALTAFALITLWRLVYFGYPLPNTYYAKVSSDHLATLRDGVLYLLKAAVHMPLLVPAILAWLLLLRSVWFAWPRSATRAAVAAVAAVIAGILAVTALEGGDHFADQRFLQPATPLLILALAVCAVYAAQQYYPGLVRPCPSIQAIGVETFVAVLVISLFGYENSKHSMAGEFHVSNNGRDFGDKLNSVTAREGPASVGVISAGGLPLVFKGQVYDLEGLNWVAMAHADPVKKGVKDHASFDAATFYKAYPDLVVLDFYTIQPGQPWQIESFHVSALKGEPNSVRFQSLYRPILVQVNGRWIGIIASRNWIGRARRKDFRVLNWSDLKFL